MELLPSRSEIVNPLITFALCSWCPFIVFTKTCELIPSTFSLCWNSSNINVPVLQLSSIAYVINSASDDRRITGTMGRYGQVCAAMFAMLAADVSVLLSQVAFSDFFDVGLKLYTCRPVG